MSSVADYDYELPPRLIAQSPLAERSAARLLVVERRSGSWRHAHVRDLPELVGPADAIVVNDTRVVPARLIGRRVATGGRWEGLYLSADEAGNWRLLGKTRGKLKPGERVTLLDPAMQEDAELLLLEQREGGVWIGRPTSSEATLAVLERVGRVPLPHYIRGGAMLPHDRERYQTVYARVPGSAAAPTAGLHLTEPLLDALRRQGTAVEQVTLHVGLDTFRPIGVERLEAHRMHSEWGCLEDAAAARLDARRAAGGRVVAIGTTSVRVLETAAAGGALAGWNGHTDLFIRPPYEFCGVDALLTNFHLPRSTLLVLVSTFAGRDLLWEAYEEAIRQEYRFYSYGDAMLIV